jgi:hypothetical protein
VCVCACVSVCERVYGKGQGEWSHSTNGYTKRRQKEERWEEGIVDRTGFTCLVKGACTFILQIFNHMLLVPNTPCPVVRDGLCACVYRRISSWMRSSVLSPSFGCL